ncbi:MAG: hypothetical protein J6386_01775 [Candidatus Synoicihabitans palmerolidicus]|nr:hypothetical protein [Candidatus Synoicihabitans palmerolidicus]
MPAPYPNPPVDTYPQASVGQDTAAHIGQVFDIEGNGYRTVTIGVQTWMIDNLRTTKLNDGQAITFHDGNNDHWFSSASAPAFTRPAHASTAEVRSRGLYYNWKAATSDKLCTKDWRLPSAEDWEVLISLLERTPR